MGERAERQEGLVSGVQVLLVDDEPAVLAGLRRSLAGRYEVHTCEDPHEALRLASKLPQLAVVVSDMRMPGMDGATLLKELRDVAPDAVRVLLTGYTGVEAAVAAINEGAIFRFLWKPCEPDVLDACLRDAVDQYRLVTAERELLECTVRGSIRALLETLALANPLAFGRAERLRAQVHAIATRMPEAGRWDIEVAAMLSQLGAITLPAELSEHLHRGEAVDDRLAHLAALLPERSADLLAEVPRFEEVRRSILFQSQRFDGRGPLNDRMAGDDIPLGARVLRVASDLDALEMRGCRGQEALAVLRAREGCYDPQILAAVEELCRGDDGARRARYLPLVALQPGMVVAEEIVTRSGVLIRGRGQSVTRSLLDRIAAWPDRDPIVEPVSVLSPRAQEVGA